MKTTRFLLLSALACTAFAVLAAPPGQPPSREYKGRPVTPAQSRPVTPRQSKPLTPKQSKPLTPKQSQPVVSKPAPSKPAPPKAEPARKPPAPPKEQPPRRDPPKKDSRRDRDPGKPNRNPPPPPPYRPPYQPYSPAYQPISPDSYFLPGNPPPPPPSSVHVVLEYGWIPLVDVISGGDAKEVLFNSSASECQIEILQGRVGFNTIVVRRGPNKQSLTISSAYPEGSILSIPVDRNVTGLRISDTAGGRYRVSIR